MTHRSVLRACATWPNQTAEVIRVGRGSGSVPSVRTTSPAYGTVTRPSPPLSEKLTRLERQRRHDHHLSENGVTASSARRTRTAAGTRSSTSMVWFWRQRPVDRSRSPSPRQALCSALVRSDSPHCAAASRLHDRIARPGGRPARPPGDLLIANHGHRCCRLQPSPFATCPHRNIERMRKRLH